MPITAALNTNFPEVLQFEAMDLFFWNENGVINLSANTETAKVEETTQTLLPQRKSINRPQLSATAFTDFH